MRFILIALFVSGCSLVYIDTNSGEKNDTDTKTESETMDTRF